MPEGSCVKARPLAEVGPRLGRARTVGLDVSAMVPRTWTPQQMECAARHGRPSRCHRGRVWRDGILRCQAQRCSVTAQPGGATLHPLSHHTGMRVRGPLQPRLVVPVARVPCGGCAPPRPPQVAALRCWSSGLLLWAVCRTTGERLPPRPLPVAAAFFFLLGGAQGNPAWAPSRPGRQRPPHGTPWVPALTPAPAALASQRKTEEQNLQRPAAQRPGEA
jgi:hypothetical protein